MSAREGIQRRMPEAEYHRGPELSSTGAKALLDAPARYAWQRHHPVEKTVYDLGSIVHALVLGKGWGISVLDYPDYKTKAAQEAQAAARKAGRIPALRHQLLMASKARRAVRAHPLAGRLLTGGEAEVSLFWTDEETGVPCRARVDYVTKWVDGRDALIDVKSTAEYGADPATLSRNAHNHGHPLQTAMYLEGAVKTGLVSPDAVFLHVHIEREQPHLVTVSQLSEDALEYGRDQYRRALALFRECTLADSWPGYPHTVVPVDLPAWAYREATA